MDNINKLNLEEEIEDTDEIGQFDETLPDLIVGEKDIIKSDDNYPDPASFEIYLWIDSMLLRGGMQIEGDLPRGAKTVGRGIELRLYKTMKDAVEEYLSGLTGTETQTDVINGLHDILIKWRKINGPVIDLAFGQLFSSGFAAGAISAGMSGKMGSYDKLAAEILQQGKYRIGNRIKLFVDETVNDFAKVIGEAYTPEGLLDLQPMVDKMHKVIPAKRFELERIARTETSAVSMFGRVFAWSNDSERNWYNYIWTTANDNRVREMKKIRASWSPLTFDECAFLWTHNEQRLPNGKFQNGNINCRCAVVRSPRDDEYTGNRFVGQMADFHKTIDFDFNV